MDMVSFMCRDLASSFIGYDKNYRYWNYRSKSFINFNSYNLWIDGMDFNKEVRVSSDTNSVMYSGGLFVI